MHYVYRQGITFFYQLKALKFVLWPLRMGMHLENNREHKHLCLATASQGVLIPYNIIPLNALPNITNLG